MGALHACHGILHSVFTSFHRLALLFGLGYALMTPALAYGADQWPTKRFKVFAGNPYIGDALGLGSDFFEFQDVFGGPGDDVIKEVERAFSEAANWYEQRGFPAPMLKPLKKDELGLYYQVYVCSEDLDQWLWDNAWALVVGANNDLVQSPWDQCGANPFDAKDTKAGLYYPNCPQVKGRKQVMIVNADSSIGANGKLTELGYQTIAHELMHAVMASTPFGKSDADCTAYGWITESIPDAISYDIAEDLWKGRYTPGSSNGHVIKRTGYRPYRESLPQNGLVPVPGGKDISAKYGTSSFWRYIADSHPDRWSVLVRPPKRKGGAPGLLQVPLPGPGGWRREVQWLQTGLKGKFNLNLSELYSMFVTYLPFQVAPMASYTKPPSNADFEHWVNKLFGPCASVNLPSGGSQSFTLDIQGMAAACVWVETTGPSGFTQVTFQAASPDEAELQGLTIGLAGTMIVSRPFPVVELKYGPGGHMASWRDFPQDGTKKTLYVISNFAAQPELSQDRTVTFSASIPNNTNTARSSSALPPARVAKPPIKPSNRRHAPSLAKQKSATSKMVQEQVNLDKETVNPNVSNSTTLSRKPREPGCAEPFRYQPCGPQMTISLSLMPGTYATLGHSNTHGGAGGQLLGSISAMAATSRTDGMETMKYLAEINERIDGHTVQIIFPLIEYGAGASFSNASITVAMAGKKVYSAVGPLDENYHPPLTGQVNIEEYTPHVIRGSFSANLAELLPGAGPNDPPIWTARGNVSGTFTSVAPFAGDERNIVIRDSDEQIANDALNALGLPPGMINRIKEDGNFPGGSGDPGVGNSGGSSSGGGLDDSDCTCECGQKATADELCQMLCEEEFAACD